MADKYLVQMRTATGIETIAELPVLEKGKVDISWLPVVGFSGSAVISEGSNANGRWIRWADGLQICFCAKVNMGSDPGVMQTITYPTAFIDTPIIMPDIQVYNGNTDSRLATSFIFSKIIYGNKAATCTLCCQTVGSTQISNVSATVMAFGHWK